MSKKKKQKKQSIVISIISTIILLGIILLGSNFNKTEEFNNFIKANNLIENQTEGNLENLIVYFIDVGQADSILIKNQDDTLLIDAGNNEDGQDVVNFIKGKGITKLNYVIGTHPHEDHIGGLDDVINSDLKIENLWMPKIQTNTKTFEDVLDAVKNKGLKVTAPNKGDSFEIGKAKCEVMTDSILKLLYEFWIVNSYDPSKVDKTKLFITNKTFTSYKNNIPEVKKEVVPPKEEYKEIKIDNLKLPGLDEEKPIDIDGKDYLK